MKQPAFSIKAALKYGWQTFKANVGLFIMVYVIIIILRTLLTVGANLVSTSLPVVASLLNIVTWIVHLIIAIGVISIALEIYQGRKPTFDNLFTTGGVFFKYLAASIIYGIIIVVGLALLVIPGVYLGVRLQFFGYLIVENKLGPIEALKQSWELTKGYFGKLLIFNLTLGLIVFSGVFLLLIGIFVAAPIALMAYAAVYKALTHKKGSQTVPAPAKSIPPVQQTPAPQTAAKANTATPPTKPVNQMPQATQKQTAPAPQPGQTSQTNQAQIQQKIKGIGAKLTSLLPGKKGKA